MIRDKIVAIINRKEADAVDQVAKLFGVEGELSEIGFIEDIMDEGLSPEETADVLIEEFIDDQPDDDDFDDFDDDEDDDDNE